MHGKVYFQQEKIFMGSRWKIGNGMEVKDWKDGWLPTPTTYKVVSPRRILDEDTTVSELVDPTTGWWNHALVDELFLDFEAETIKKIPLTPSGPEDKLIWVGNNAGHFTVTSAYRVIKA